jgi:hypothetical protein
MNKDVHIIFQKIKKFIRKKKEIYKINEYIK